MKSVLRGCIRSAALIIAFGCDSPSEPAASLDWSIETTPSPAVVDELVTFSITIRNSGDKQVSFTGRETEIKRLEDSQVLLRTGTSGGGVPIAAGAQFGPTAFTHRFSTAGTYEFSQSYTGLGLTVRDTVEVTPSN